MHQLNETLTAAKVKGIVPANETAIHRILTQLNDTINLGAAATKSSKPLPKINMAMLMQHINTSSSTRRRMVSQTARIEGMAHLNDTARAERMLHLNETAQAGHMAKRNETMMGEK